MWKTAPELSCTHPGNVGAYTWYPAAASSAMLLRHWSPNLQDVHTYVVQSMVLLPQLPTSLSRLWRMTRTMNIENVEEGASAHALFTCVVVLHRMKR